MPPATSVIIVNWNGRVHLADCLDSLAAQDFRDFEVILVDNGSEDDSVAFVRRFYPWVRVLELPTNTGFAGGNNRGLELARGRYIVTLNNDTKVAGDWLTILVGVAESHAQVGMVGCRICVFSEPNRIDSLGLGICSDGMARGHYRNLYRADLALPEVMEILCPSACAALYRREMLDEIGFFDEDFFAYAEDVDLGLRGRLAGWPAVLANRALVYHKYSQSSGSLSPLKVYQVERNHYWVAVKTFPVAQLLGLPLFTLLRWLVQCRALVRRRGTGAEFYAGSAPLRLVGAQLRGLLAALGGIPPNLAKRRGIMAQRRLAPTEFSRLLKEYRIGYRELLDDK